MIRLLHKFIEGVKILKAGLSSASDLKDSLIVEDFMTDLYKSKIEKNSIPSFSKAQDEGDEDAFYYLFENLFRGSIEKIKKRQSIYLPYVNQAHANSEGLFFLDAGCGRGEFLTLLHELGVPARGIDINRLTTDLLKKTNVDAVLSDAFEYLKGLENNSLIGLSMFQVTEHLDFKHVTNIVKTAFKKISFNGIIILESVNPYCPIALGNFYLDPTHIRPYAPDLMKFMLEWYHFENIKIIYSSLLPKHLHFRKRIMNYQDYAVIGEKI